MDYGRFRYFGLINVMFAGFLICKLRGAESRVDEFRNVRVAAPEDQWVESTLKKLSLECKVGQLLQLRYYADYSDFGSYDYKHLRDEIRHYQIGSVVLGMHFNNSGPVRNSPLNAARVANELQRESELPLLLGADIERGTASRLTNVPAFPWPMAFGAAADTSSVRAGGAEI